MPEGRYVLRGRPGWLASQAEEAGMPPGDAGRRNERVLVGGFTASRAAGSRPHERQFRGPTGGGFVAPTRRLRARTTTTHASAGDFQGSLALWRPDDHNARKRLRSASLTCVVALRT